jgi:putative transposase
MGRIARIVIPGIPHHVTQRGNRRQRTFFVEADYDRYIDLVSASCKAFGVQIWAYALMPNHVHLLAVPDSQPALSLAMGQAHLHYTRAINAREGWTGYLWQGRFASCPMRPAHALAAARYVELNPVRAGLVERPEDWPWSSARAHLAGEDNRLVSVKPCLDQVGDWSQFIATEGSAILTRQIRRHTSTGRPLGDVTLDR